MAICTIDFVSSHLKIVAFLFLQSIERHIDGGVFYRFMYHMPMFSLHFHFLNMFYFCFVVFVGVGDDDDDGDVIDVFVVVVFNCISFNRIQITDEGYVHNFVQ